MKKHLSEIFRGCLWVALGVIFGLANTGCSGERARAPFVATPAPATVAPSSKGSAEKAPSATPDAPETVDISDTNRLAGRIHGKDQYPCEGHATCSERSPEDRTLYTVHAGVEFLDPGIGNDSEGQLLIEEIFEGLVVRGPRSDMGLLPGVAERWTISDDGLTYTFHLRKNAMWSHGRHVKADDFVYAWTRALNPEIGSRSAEGLWFLKNAKAYHEGRLKDATTVGVVAKDPLTLEVTLENPSPFWLNLVAGGAYSPVPKEVVQAHGKQWTRPENIVGNGPYRLTRFDPRDRIILTRSESYWDHENIQIPRVVFYHSNDETQATNRYDLGQIQWQRSSLPVEKLQRYLGEARPDFFIDGYLCYYYYVFRNDQPPFDDPRVRRALNMAIDKERLVSHITRGIQLPADGPMPAFYEKTMGYKKVKGDPFDPEAAQALLADAGFPGGAGFPPVTLIYNTFESHRLIAEFVQRGLKDHLGIEIRPQNMEWKSLLKRLNAGDFQMARSAWCCIPDPWDHFMVFYSKSENNYSNYNNPEFDALFDAANATTDNATRMMLFNRMEQIIQRDAPIAPLYHYTKAFLKKPVLRGMFPQLENKHLIRYLYWGDEKDARPHPAVRRLMGMTQ